MSSYNNSTPVVIDSRKQSLVKNIIAQTTILKGAIYFLYGPFL